MIHFPLSQLLIGQTFLNESSIAIYPSHKTLSNYLFLWLIMMNLIKWSITSALILVFTFFSQYSFSQITQLKKFGDNPGELQASYYLPKSNTSSLVVLLHGCAQDGNEFANQSGFLGLAKKHQFAVLIPQQNSNNNIKRCFNWYSDKDFMKNKGEGLSIKNMIITLQKQISAQDVYIIGLSAGGAMVSSMLVNYPDLFKAGAVVAGIPFPCADGLITAISCMNNGPSQTVGELVSLVQQINPKQVVWPKLSVWTGTNDKIVNPLNSSVYAKHWVKLLKLENTPIVDKHLGYTVTRWHNNTTKEIEVELVEVAQLNHGIMVNTKVENGGEVSSYLLSSPISTARYVIDFWKL